MQFNNFFDTHTIYITLEDDKFYKLNKDDFSKMEEVEVLPSSSRENPIMVIHKKQFDVAKSFLLDLQNPFRIDISTAQIYHKIGFLSYEELTSYSQQINGACKEYEKEYETLHNMFICSTRYLNSKERQELGSKQQEIDQRIVHEIRELYRKYTDRINKKCIEATGESIF